MDLLREIFSIKRGDNVTTLVSFSGEERPELGKPFIYEWKVELSSKEVVWVDYLIVDLQFSSEYNLTIDEIVPRKAEKERKVQLHFTASPGVTVEFPFGEKQIHAVQSSLHQAIWTFKDFKLEETYGRKLLFSGKFRVKFSEGVPPLKSCENVEIPIILEIRPAFCQKHLLWKKSSKDQPIVPHEISKFVIKPVRPYSPKRGTLNTEIQVVNGILKVGSIRDVAFRAESMMMFFEKFREAIPQQFRQMITDCSYQIGKSWLYETRKKRVLTRPTIEDWCYYDSHAGLGEITYDRLKREIAIKNPFTEEFCNGGMVETACNFWSGYIEGIVSAIKEESYSATRVGCILNGESSCIFRIRKAKS